MRPHRQPLNVQRNIHIETLDAIWVFFIKSPTFCTLNNCGVTSIVLFALFAFKHFARGGRLVNIWSCTYTLWWTRLLVHSWTNDWNRMESLLIQWSRLLWWNQNFGCFGGGQLRAIKITQWQSHQELLLHVWLAGCESEEYHNPWKCTLGANKKL